MQGGFYQGPMGFAQGGWGQPVMSYQTVPPQMQYAMSTPPHGHVQQPQQMGYVSPQCTVPSAMECWRWGIPANAVIVNKPKVAAAIVAYDKIIANELKSFVAACHAVGNLVERQGAAVKETFEAQRFMLDKTLKLKNPKAGDINQLMSETQAAIAKVEALCDLALEKPATYKPHTRMIAGAMSAMGWVAADEPTAYVKDTLNAIPVYGRQVREIKGGGEQHTQLVVALTTLVRALLSLIDTHCAKGLLSVSGEGLKDEEKYEYPAQKIVQDYRLLITNKLQPFLRAARTLPPPKGAVVLSSPMEKLAVCTEQAFQAQCSMLDTYVVKHKIPCEEALLGILGPTTEALNEVEELEEDDGPFQVHVQLVGSGLGSLAWVSVASPVLYVTEILNSVPAHGDRVRVHGEEHANFVSLFRELMRGLLAYVKEHHPSGVQWNPTGKELTFIE